MLGSGEVLVNLKERQNATFPMADVVGGGRERPCRQCRTGLQAAEWLCISPNKWLRRAPACGIKRLFVHARTPPRMPSWNPINSVLFWQVFTPPGSEPASALIANIIALSCWGTFLSDGWVKPWFVHNTWLTTPWLLRGLVHEHSFLCQITDSPNWRHGAWTFANIH